MKVKAIAALMLSASIFFAGCGGSDEGSVKSTDKNTINISLHQDPPKLDPRNSTAFVERHVFQSLFDKLVDVDSKGNIVPMLAEKWEISPDGTEYTFTIKQGVKFHDGTDFNAEAVKFNIERFKETSSSRKNELKSVSEVTVVEPYTVKFTLAQPYAPLLSMLADRAGMMCSPAAVQKEGDNFMNSPVGSGPYMFKERVKGSTIELVKNANYWRKDCPKAETLVYKIMNDANVALVNLKSGQLDMTNRFPLNEANNYASDAQLTVANVPGPGFKGYVLNNEDPKFADARVRKAIEKVIDREIIVKVALFGVGTPGRTALPSSNFAYDAELDKPQAPDIEGAKKLMQEAGMENGFKFTLLTDTDPVSQQVAQLVQKQLKEIKVDMEIQKVDFGTLLDRATKKDIEAAMIGWSGRIDPDGNLYEWVYTGARMNYMQYSSPEVDALLDEARVVTDNAERKAIYKKVMAKLLDDMPYIYLYHENNAFGISKELKGFKDNPDGMIRTAELTKK